MQKEKSLKPGEYLGKKSENTYRVNHGMKAYYRNIGVKNQHAVEWQNKINELLKEIRKHDKNAIANGRSINDLKQILEFVRMRPEGKRTMNEWDSEQKKKKKNINKDIGNIILNFK